MSHSVRPIAPRRRFQPVGHGLSIVIDGAKQERAGHDRLLIIGGLEAASIDANDACGFTEGCIMSKYHMSPAPTWKLIDSFMSCAACQSGSQCRSVMRGKPNW